LKKLKFSKKQQGVVLLEALIAVLIFSMGILALVGLQGAMVKNTSDNKYRADASFVAQNRIAEMWANSNNLASFNEPGTAIAALPNGNRTTTVAARGLATVTISWQAPGAADIHNYTVQTYIGAQ
jgi:type IV pilus assembly protein PilV